MPIYEFQCQYCHAIEEHILRMSDAGPSQCSSCSRDQSLKKIISRPSVISALSTHQSEIDSVLRDPSSPGNQPFYEDRKWNEFKDGDDHYEEHDPNDPATFKRHQQEKKKKAEAKAKGELIMKETYRKLAAGED